MSFHYITQNPGPFGGCAGIPRLFMRQACSSRRWAALYSSGFVLLQRRSAAALARGHILECTLFLETRTSIFRLSIRRINLQSYVAATRISWIYFKLLSTWIRVQLNATKEQTTTCRQILPTCKLRHPASI